MNSEGNWQPLAEALAAASDKETSRPIPCSHTQELAKHAIRWLALNGYRVTESPPRPTPGRRPSVAHLEHQLQRQHVHVPRETHRTNVRHRP